jgi:transposase-like protein
VSNRDSKRLDAIRSLPCCQCGASPRSQAAHSNFSAHGKGKGIKADDRYTIPLCHSCHSSLDQNLSQQTRQQQLDWFLKKLNFINEVLNDIEQDEATLF